MALDPRLSLGIQPLQIPMPDLGQTMVTGQNILAQQAMQQQRMLTLSELLRERQQRLAAEEYVSRYGQSRPRPAPGLVPSVIGASRHPPAPPPLPAVGTNPEAAGPMVSDVPPLPSAIPPAPQQPVPVQLPSSAPQTAATPQGQSVAVPGESTMLTPPAAPMPQAPQGPAFPSYLEMAQFGKPGRDIYEDYQKAMLGDAQMQKNLEQTALARLGYASMLLAVPQNDTMYQPILTDLQQKMPEFAASLPTTFDPETIAKVQKGLQMAASRAKGVQYGTSLHQFYDPATKQVVVRQVSNAGGLVEPQGAAGLIPIGPMMTVDTATGTALIPRNQPQMPGTAPGAAPAVIPKELGPAAEQTAGGTVTGKATAEYEATFPQRKLVAEQALDRLTEKHTQAEQKLDRAIALMKSGNFPTTNRLGGFLSAMGYEPGLDLRAMLDSLRAELGFTELVDLKNTSGAGLGQVSDNEGRRLDSTIATINPDRQSDAGLLESLERIRTSLRTTRERLNRNYQTEFVERRGQPFSGGQRQPVRQSRPQAKGTLTREMIDATLADPRNQGRTEQDIIDAARNKGYTWEGR